MLAAERTAEAERQIGGAVEEFAEEAQTLDGAEIEVDAQVDAALPVVTVERAAVAILAHEGRESAQISTEMRGGNAGIVPTLKALRLAGDKNRGAESRLTDAPDSRGVFGGVDTSRRSFRPGVHGADKGFSLGLSFFSRPGAHFDQQKTTTGREQSNIVDRQMLAAHEVEQQAVEAFQTDGAEFESARNRIGGEECVIERQCREHPEGWAGSQVECG